MIALKVISKLASSRNSVVSATGDAQIRGVRNEIAWGLYPWNSSHHAAKVARFLTCNRDD